MRRKQLIIWLDYKGKPGNRRRLEAQRSIRTGGADVSYAPPVPFWNGTLPDAHETLQHTLFKRIASVRGVLQTATAQDEMLSKRHTDLATCIRERFNITCSQCAPAGHRAR